MLENGLIDVGPVIPEDQPVFHFESAKEDEDEDLEDDYEPFPNPEEEFSNWKSNFHGLQK